jgi:hypothetical protein
VFCIRKSALPCWNKYFLFLIFISSHIHSRFSICRSGLCLQLIWSFTKTTTTSTTVSNFIHNSVSFLHLNIQSITPKLDLIAAEYSFHEILSFTESWLRPHVSDDTLIGLVHPKFADCYWEEYKMFHISIFCSWFLSQAIYIQDSLFDPTSVLYTEVAPSPCWTK